MRVSGILIPCLFHFVLATGAEQSPEEARLDFGAGVLRINGFAMNINDKDGINAEIEARRNGVSALENAVKKACHENSFKTFEDWQRRITSVGSEFYPNPSLKIGLTVPIKSVFQIPGEWNESLWKTPSGDGLAFRIPVTPLTSKNCQTLILKFNNKTWKVWPTKVQAKANGHTLNLHWADGGTLILNPSAKMQEIIDKIPALSEDNNHPILHIPSI